MPEANNQKTPLVPEQELRPLGRPIEANLVGMRLDKMLALKYPFLSRSGWQKKIEDQTLLVNEKNVPTSYKLKFGDKITLKHSKLYEPAVDNGIYLIYEELGVMAVYKPGNLPMHENGPYRHNTLAKLVAEKFGPEWSAVHRLDRETSGIVLCANTPRLRKQLANDLEEKRIEKTYLAIVHGTPKKDEWIVDEPIGDLKESKIRIKRWVIKDGQNAITKFKTLKIANGYAIIQAIPLTGRTNQIRVHAAYSGLPIVGDKLYHPDEQVFLDYFEYGNTLNVQDKTGFSRHCLHAGGIKFKHPVSYEEKLISIELPDDMKVFWEKISSC